jgi:hypothetical protein
MPADSASAASSTGIQSQGGSITKNGNNLWIVAIVAIALIVWLRKKRRKK